MNKKTYTVLDCHNTKELHTINSLILHCSYSGIVKLTRRDSKLKIPAKVHLGRTDKSMTTATVRNHLVELPLTSLLGDPVGVIPLCTSTAPIAPQ